MPLYKRKSFQLLEPPEDLDPKEHVFQVRFTKEIFRNYGEYLKRLNLYRQRVWTCKVTWKTNLTYEEALLSECRATEKVQQFPTELMSPVLHMIQYSNLTLKDLTDAIYTKLQEHLYVGIELYGRKEQSVCACKILELPEIGRTKNYKVGWLGKDKNVLDTSVISSEDLVRKKPPLSRNIIKAFIRESTIQSMPWVVHEELAKKHGISTGHPKELQDAQNGKKRKRTENGISNSGISNKKSKKEEEEPIKYPIDDLLVRPAVDDPIFTECPSLCRDFNVPMDCVGDLLMVWNFCSSFSKLLNLWPFSLEDFENAICHKDTDLTLIMESHSAFFRFLIKDEGNYFTVVKDKKRKSKITLVNWVEYLCDFLEMENRPNLSDHLRTIKRGHYGLLDARVKLSIFRELVEEALNTDAIRDELNEHVEQQQALVATKRGSARKQKEEQNLKAQECATEEANKNDTLENSNGNMHHCDLLEDGNSKDGSKKTNGKRRQKTNTEGLAEKVNTTAGTGENLKEQKRGQVRSKEVQERTPEELQKDQLEREMEKLSIRTNPLGKDRDYNRYWFFRREGRLFIESSDSNQWGYYTSKEELDALLGSLNPKGERERALKKQLEKFYIRISNALQKKAKDTNQRILLEEAVLRRSTRVRAQPRNSQATAFLRYVNKWKEN